MTDYDKDKAKALFDQHVIPAVREGVGFFVNLRDDEAVSHYVITAEMLRVLREAAFLVDGSDCTDSYRLVAEALFNHLHEIDTGQSSTIDWAQAIQSDPPKDPWRIAADEAMDKGLPFTRVLDAIEKALAK